MSLISNDLLSKIDWSKIDINSNQIQTEGVIRQINSVFGKNKPVQEQINPDGSGTRVTNTIDKDGNMVTMIEQLGVGGLLLHKQVQVKNKQGQIIKLDDVQNTYDNDGKLQKSKRVTADAKSKTKTQTVQTYNDNGKPITKDTKTITQKGRHKLTSTAHVNYEYDENGNLTRSVGRGKDYAGKPMYTEINYENNLPAAIHNRSYQKGSLTETFTDCKKSAAGLPEKTIIYAKDGKTVQEIIENTFDEDGILCAQKRTDAHGNVKTYDYSKVDGNFEIGNQQGRGDCYLLASINALRETETGHDMLKQTVTKNSDGSYTITFPGAKVSRDALINGEGGASLRTNNGTTLDKLPEDKVYIQESYTVTEEELKAALKQQGKKYSVGDRDVVLLEVAFEKYRQDVDKTVRDNNIAPDILVGGISIAQGSVGTDDVLSSGKAADAMFILTGHKSSDYYKAPHKTPTCYINSDMTMVVEGNNGLLSEKAMPVIENGGTTNNIDNLITKLQRDSADGKLDEYAASASFIVSSQEVNGEIIPGGGHALTITKADSKYVYLRNPWDPEKEIKMSIADFKRSATSVNLMPLKEAGTTSQTIQQQMHQVLQQIQQNQQSQTSVSPQVQQAVQQAVQQINSSAQDTPQQSVPQQTTHTVRRGDTLWKIAKNVLGKNATPKQITDFIEQVVKLNGIKNSNRIYVGQEFILPSPKN